MRNVQKWTNGYKVISVLVWQGNKKAFDEFAPNAYYVDTDGDDFTAVCMQPNQPVTTTAVEKGYYLIVEETPRETASSMKVLPESVALEYLFGNGYTYYRQEKVRDEGISTVSNVADNDYYEHLYMNWQPAIKPSDKRSHLRIELWSDGQNNFVETWQYNGCAKDFALFVQGTAWRLDENSIVHLDEFSEKPHTGDCKLNLNDILVLFKTSPNVSHNPRTRPLYYGTQSEAIDWLYTKNMHYKQNAYLGYLDMTGYYDALYLSWKSRNVTVTDTDGTDKVIAKAVDKTPLVVPLAVAPIPLTFTQFIVSIVVRIRDYILGK